MKLGRIWNPGPEARLLPVEKLHRPTVAVMAIMTFAMVIVAAAGLSLSNAAGRIASGAENRFVIVVPAAVAPQLESAVSAARSVPGVRSVSAVPESEMRRTLERWMGEAASSRDLPVPALATVELAPGANASAVAKAVAARVPQATTSAETVELAPMLRSLRALKWLALSLVLLMGAATAAAIVLAARGALDTHRSTVDIMHGIGATDAQLTRLFQRKIAGDALAGALGGSVAAALLLLLLGGAIAAAMGEYGGASPLGLIDLMLLGLLPVGAVVLAIAVARRTLLRALREAL